MIVCGILALAVVIANLTVIIVLTRSPKYPSNQIIYKLSLAAADLLVGIFVLPSFISTLYIYHISPYQRRTFDYPSTSNQTFNQSMTGFNGVNATYNVYFLPRTNSVYKNFFGCMTTLSIAASVFSLLLASHDRFRAVHSPLTYDGTKVTWAKGETVGLWTLALVLGILPAIVPELKYRIVAGGLLITVFEEVSVIMHGTFLGVSFLGMWTFTITIVVIVKQQTKSRKKMASTKNNLSKIERRLANTLTVMVGVFTGCIFPALIFALVPESVANINSENIKILNKKAASAVITMNLVSVIILASNSLWNCFIYSIRNKEFRKDAKSLFNKVLAFLGLKALKRKPNGFFLRHARQGRRASAARCGNLPKESSTYDSNKVLSTSSTNTPTKSKTTAV